MPAKSHRKAKRKEKQQLQARTTRQDITQSNQTISSTITSATVLQSKPAGTSYRYVGTELRSIIVLSGIMLIIIVLLSLVL